MFTVPEILKYTKFENIELEIINVQLEVGNKIYLCEALQV